MSSKYGALSIMLKNHFVQILWQVSGVINSFWLVKWQIIYQISDPCLYFYYYLTVLLIYESKTASNQNGSTE